jgi:flagellar hook-basal body complex protein FliE
MIATDALFSHRLAGVSGSASTTSAASATPAASTASEAGGQDFSSLLQSLAGDATRAVQAGEQAAVAQMRGRGTVQGAVEAIMKAEQSLQSAIAIRDKAVAAYQELSRMQI